MRSINFIIFIKFYVFTGRAIFNVFTYTLQGKEYILKGDLFN